MLNHIVAMGRLTRDPELRQTTSGVNVCSFTIACGRDFKTKDGKEAETDFIDCVAWRTTAEFVSWYLAKGRMAIVSGRLQVAHVASDGFPTGSGLPEGFVPDFGAVDSGGTRPY